MQSPRAKLHSGLFCMCVTSQICWQGTAIVILRGKSLCKFALYVYFLFFIETLKQKNQQNCGRCRAYEAETTTIWKSNTMTTSEIWENWYIK